jgi:DNA-binding transcriptional LysR family regulator
VLLNRMLSHARLRHWQVLVRVAELGSFQRAAQDVGLSQPAVTHIISNLESLLGVALFQRHARGARPTDAAKALMPAARQVLDAVGQGAEAVAARLADGQSVVRVSASAAALSGLLGPGLAGFSEAHPAVQVHVTLAEADVLSSVLKRDEVDLVMCRAPTVLPEGWRFTPMLDDRLVVVCAATHRLARRRRVSAHTLGQETWLVAPVEAIARQALEAMAEQHGWALRRSPVVTRALNLTWSMLALGKTVSLLPLSLVQPWVTTGQLVVVDTAPAGDLAPLGALWREADERPAAALLRQGLANG